MLSDEQVNSFKKDGHLILRGFIDDEIISAWQSQFWDHLGCRINEPGKWPDKVEGFQPSPLFGSMPELTSIAEQFGGGNFNGGGCGVLTRWPDTDQSWAMPDTGHLDGYPGEGCQAILMMGATTYLHDVESKGGAYIYWPGSHNIAHRYFRKYPDRIEGTFRETPEWENRGWGIFSDDNDESPREFLAKAGDVILWHGWLCHSGSSNISSSPRVGFFARWIHNDDAGIRNSVPEDPWHHWSI